MAGLAKKFLAAAVAALGIGATGVQTAQAACYPVSANEIYTREYNEKVNACYSNSSNPRTADRCVDKARYVYEVKMARTPDPYSADYCDPRFVIRPQHPPVIIYQPAPQPIYVPPPVYMERAPVVIDPLTEIFGGAIIYNNNSHHQHRQPHYVYPQQHRGHGGYRR